VAAEAETPAPPSSVEALEVERRKGGFVGLRESVGLKMRWCLEEKESGRRVSGGGNKDIDMEIVFFFWFMEFEPELEHVFVCVSSWIRLI
jgi:hypothetical protein